MLYWPSFLQPLEPKTLFKLHCRPWMYHLPPPLSQRLHGLSVKFHITYKMLLYAQAHTVYTYGFLKTSFHPWHVYVKYVNPPQDAVWKLKYVCFLKDRSERTFMFYIRISLGGTFTKYISELQVQAQNHYFWWRDLVVHYNATPVRLTKCKWSN